MDQFVKDIIKDWAVAYKIASENSALLLRDPSDAVLEECSIRMSGLRGVEELLLELTGRPNLPKPLVDYLEARFDRGCTVCWLSSPSHTDCKMKINRYFRTEQDLVTFGLYLA